MFLITAEEAKKSIEPPRLVNIKILPAQVTVAPGKRQAFTAKGLDQHGRDIDAGKVAWSATGGTIDKDGVFLAGADEGNFLVTGRAGEATGTASTTISKGNVPPPRPPVPPALPKSLSWEGDIPPQKWMNFYTKVLSKFAVGKGLKLTVRFELSSDGEIPRQKIEETRIALRELGLDDDIVSQSAP